MRNKLLISVLTAIFIIIVTTYGTTFAYFSSTANAGNIGGETYNFDIDLTSTPEYEATMLVPIKDNMINQAINKTNNKCIDNKGYEVCSLYKLTLTNHGNAELLNGYIETTSTTYTTTNLKYQLFSDNYTALSTSESLAAIGKKSYFKDTANNYVHTEIDTTPINYYLVIWLSETNESQNEDMNKDFSGNIVFESINGNQISASFST